MADESMTDDRRVCAGAVIFSADHPEDVSDVSASSFSFNVQTFNFSHRQLACTLSSLPVPLTS